MEFWLVVGLLIGVVLAWAAIIMTAVVMGRRGPGTLFRQLRVWRVGIGWYLIAVLLPAGLWLQEHRSALIAALVIGVVWGLWHVPTFIAQGHTTTPSTGRFPEVSRCMPCRAR